MGLGNVDLLMLLCLPLLNEQKFVGIFSDR